MILLTSQQAISPALIPVMNTVQTPVQGRLHPVGSSSSSSGRSNSSSSASAEINNSNIDSLVHEHNQPAQPLTKSRGRKRTHNPTSW